MSAVRPPTGHVFRIDRVRGPVWHAKYRLLDGRQVDPDEITHAQLGDSGG